MARQRRVDSRGTRRSSGIESGVTWASNPSGVTIGTAGLETASGLITPTELNYINGSVGYVIGNTAAGKLLTSGVTNWSGNTIALATGLSTIEGFTAEVRDEGTSIYALVVHAWNLSTPNGVSAGIYFKSSETGGGSLAITQAPGCSIAWMAHGT